MKKLAVKSGVSVNNRPQRALEVVDFARFSDLSGKRPVLATPWNYKGFVYATDATILIRIPSGNIDSESAFDGNPAAMIVEKQFLDNTPPPPECFTPLPAFAYKLPLLTSCPECHGSGAILTLKRKAIICPLCRGEQSIENPKGVALGNRWMIARYLTKMSFLPDVRVAADYGSPEQVLHFSFAGAGEGHLMPSKGKNP